MKSTTTAVVGFERRICTVSLRAAILTLVMSLPAFAQTANESNLWFGGDEGIEVVFKTGVNLAHTDESPKVDARMTTRSRSMDEL